MAQDPIAPWISAGGYPGSTSTGDEFEARAFRPQTHKIVAARVSTPKGNPVANATVVITNNVAAPAKILATDHEGDFVAEYNLFDEEMGRNFIAIIQVTKKGFQVAHRITPMGGSVNNTSMAITLRPIQPEDPNLLSQVDLINGVAPRLRQLGPSDGLATKQEKDYARGVQEFLDRGHPDRAVLDFTKVVKLSPSCLKCRTMLALAELSWGDWDGPQRELGESVNAIIKDQKVGSPEPLLAYGVLVSWRHDPAKASLYLMDALTYAPQDSLALQELGRAECQELNWYSGSESLKKALAAGAGPEARFMHAEALLWTVSPQAAEAELNLYLDGRSLKSMPPRVRALWDHIQAGKKDETIIAAAKARAQARGEITLDYLHHPPQNLPDFEPTADQAHLDAILAALGKNVADLFTGLPNICSVERVHQEKLNRDGKATSSQVYKFRYLALAPDHPWGPSVDEYRADGQGKGGSPMDLSDNGMLTEGFVSAPLIFHPAYQSGSSFRLLGRQKVKGRNTFVIAYAQDPAKTALSGTFTYGSITRPTYTQGLAWIDVENYEIVRITSDLLTPLPQLRLGKETTDIEFNAVQFKQMAQKFWLPEAVTVTLNWNGRIYRNNHVYSEFLVSNVQSTQKIGKPKGAVKTTEGPTPPLPASKP